MRSSCITFLVYTCYVIELCVQIIYTDAYTQSDDDMDLYDKLASYPYLVIEEMPEEQENTWQTPDVSMPLLSVLAGLPADSASSRDAYLRDLTFTNDVTDPLTSPLHQRTSRVQLVRKKKSSVSWLLAAAIRMCQAHPAQCLDENALQGLDMRAVDVHNLLQAQQG